MKLRELVAAALFVALIALTTAFVKIPLAIAGYIHLGDTFILLACYLLRPRWAIPACGIGSALADLISGFVIFAPATLVIKAGMAFLFGLLVYKKPLFWREIVGAIVASAFMLAGYFVFEGFLYGWAAALANVPMASIQPAACSVLGVALIQAASRIPAIRDRRTL